MKVNTDFLRHLVGYIEHTQKTLTKQANVIKRYKKERKGIIEKISSVVDMQVISGEVPNYLSDTLKENLTNNPNKFIEMLTDKTGKNQAFGEPSEYKKQSSDPMQDFALS